jgi:parallel beta-helix repeat protein
MLLLGAGQAQADSEPFFVDTTSDAGALTACTAAAADCSLRGAFASADDGDPAGDIDTIIFDATIFDGGSDDTVVMPTAGVGTDENLELQANCSTTQPCAAIDGPPADLAIRVQDGTFSMKGVAIFDGLQGLQHQNGADGLNLVNNWFGLKLDGTVAGNGIGLYIAGPNADVGGIGQTGNVFAGNGLGLQMVGNAATDINVQGNLFGVKADGSTVAANTGRDIDISGANINQAPSDVFIGGSPNATQACDEGCNVIAGAGGYGIDLSASLGGGFTSTAHDVNIENNHIGVNAAGTAATGAGTLVGVGSADNVVVADNMMAGGFFAVEAGSGAEAVNIESNSIGATADGTEVLKGTTEQSIAVNSNATLPASIVDNLIVEDFLVSGITLGGSAATVSGNRIGVAGTIYSGGSVGIRIQGSSHAIDGNSISETLDDGIRLTDTSGSAIAGNSIGVDGPVDGAGIAITADAGSSVGNGIGSNDPPNGNRFGYTGEDAIQIVGDGQDQNQILGNLGGPVNGFFVDLEGTPGAGNGADGPNSGIAAPKVGKITEKAIPGSGVPGATVWVYRTSSIKGVFPDSLTKLIGTKTVKADGSWKLKPGGKVKKSWVITALQNDSTGNGSELTKGKSRRK